MSACGFLLAAAVALVLPAAPPPVSLQSYQQQLPSTYSLLLRATRGSTPAYGPVRAELRRLALVRMPDGSLVRTDMPHLAGELVDGDSRSAQPVLSQLGATERALEATRPLAAEPSDARSLQAVMRDPRFHPHVSWLQRLEAIPGRIISALVDFLTRLIARLLPGSAPSGRLVDLVVAVLFLVVCGVVGFFVARSVAQRRERPAALTLADDEPVSWEDADRRAREAIERGDYRLAFRFRFLGMILQLQERRVLDVRPGTTNREYLRLLRQSGNLWTSLGPAMEELTDAFDRAWYGHAGVTAADLERYGALIDTVLHGQGARAA